MNEEWTKGAKYWDHAWNPVIGCEPVSEGCENCYAKAMWSRFHPGTEFAPEPVKKAVPRKDVVFVGNMTDIFGEWNSQEQIRHWLARLSRNAVNLVLTKRADRLSDIFHRYMELYSGDWIYYGVTCENQQRAGERIPHLLGLTGIRRWLSLEPLLGEIDLDNLQGGIHRDDWGNIVNAEPYWNYLDGINWVVVGAESGREGDRRECKIEWVESIVDQCQSAGVPVFVKQLHIDGKLVKDIDKFPEHLQIRQVPWNN